MKLCYQVATPDVAIAESVTAYQGPLQKTFGDLAALGYDGVELMTIDPGKLDWNEVRQTAADLGLVVGLVCTGEVFGQLGLSFADPDAGRRAEAIARVNGLIDLPPPRTPRSTLAGSAASTSPASLTSRPRSGRWRASAPSATTPRRWASGSPWRT